MAEAHGRVAGSEHEPKEEPVRVATYTRISTDEAHQPYSRRLVQNLTRASTPPTLRWIAHRATERRRGPCAEV
jgi:hypothetical protein